MRSKISIVLMLYFILGLFLFKYFQYYVITDFVPYADIAKKYLSGDFYHAINGIWGVLISWLLIPFLLLKINPLVSFKILNFLIGGLAIFGLNKLAKKFALTEMMEWIVLLTAVPIVFSFVFVHTTPDLLVACILIFYLNVVFDINYTNSAWYGVYAGLLGGLGYLAKHYVFPFIALHLLLTHLFYFFGNTKKEVNKKIIINLVVSYLVFLAISGSWIFILSGKYGFFTIGTSMNYNHVWMSPDSLGQAPEYLGLQTPPNPTANSMWEDLTYYIKLMPGRDWSPMDSWFNFRHQIRLVIQNLRETFFIFNKFSLVFGVIIFLASASNVLARIRKKEILSDKLFLSLVVIILYSSGYLLIRTSDRYILIGCFLLLLMGALYVDKCRNYLSDVKKGKILAALIVVLFSLSFLITPIRRLLINVNQDKWIYDLSTVLKSRYVRGNIASNKNWSNTSILSYYLDTKYFGMPSKNSTIDDLFRQFENHKIDYYLEWGENVDVFNSENKYPAIKLDNLIVYKLR